MGTRVRVCNVGMVEYLKMGTHVRVCNVGSENKGGNVCASKQDLFNSRKY